MYEVVTGIPAFSNFYHENLNMKRYDLLLFFIFSRVMTSFHMYFWFRIS